MLDYIRRAIAAVRRGHQFVTHGVWRIGRPGEVVPHGLIIKNIRVAILLFRGVMEETLLLRASALTFATLLFIVPFLTFMFFFITTFNLGEGVYRRLSEQLDDRLTKVITMIRGEEDEKHREIAPEARAPFAQEKVQAKPYNKPGTTTTPVQNPFFPLMPDVPGIVPVPEENTPAIPVASTQAAERQRARERDNEALKRSITGFFLQGVAQTNGDPRSPYRDPVQMLVNMAEQGARDLPTLGLSGLIFVITTVFGLMRNVETSVNAIWGVPRNRNWFRVLSDYMMITVLLPFVAATVIGITAALESGTIKEVLGPLAIGLRGIQLFVICFTMSLLNWLIPNTEVKVGNAFLGGTVAGGLWVLNSWAYVKFQIGLARYTPFFSGFALFPLLMMWIYLSWVILLFGSLITFAYQNEKTFAMERLSEDATIAYREALALRTVVELARRFRDGLPGLVVHEAAYAWNVPMRLLNETLECLVAARLVTRCATEPISFQPARSPENTRAWDVLRAVREAGEDPSMLRHDLDYGEIYAGLDTADRNCLYATIAELVRRTEPKALPIAQPEA